MKKNVFRKFSPRLLWLTLSLLLVSILAGCSGLGDTNAPPTPVATTGSQAHLSPTVSHLQGAQQGQVSIFTLPKQTHIKNLVSIPSSSTSSLWFGEHDTNTIGELDAQGQLTEFALPTANAQPGWGVLGLHGNFWVSEEGVNRIAEISPQGAFTEYTPPTANAQPGQLACWGAMVWFTESAAHKLGRVDQNQQIAEFSLSGTPDQLASAGPDDTSGQLWFTEPGARKVGHITVDGQISEFPLPTTITSMSSVVGDQKGDLWFTTGQRTRDQLGYVTPDGHFTFFSTGRSHTVAQLLANGDILTFIESQSNTIWTIDQQGHTQTLLVAQTGTNLPTPLVADAGDGSFWYASNSGQQSQIWNMKISPYGP